MRRSLNASADSAPATRHGLSANIADSKAVDDVFRNTAVRTLLVLANKLRKEFRGSAGHPWNNFSLFPLLSHMRVSWTPTVTNDPHNVNGIVSHIRGVMDTCKQLIPAFHVFTAWHDLRIC